MRPYETADYDTCLQMITEEGITDFGFHKKDTNETWIYEDDGQIKGFFSMRMFNGIPYLVHFVVAKACRDFQTGWRMLMAFKDIIRERGAKEFYTNCPVSEHKRARVLSRLFRKKPYAVEKGQYYWLVPLERSAHHG